jgi:hypothetical protein
MEQNLFKSNHLFEIQDFVKDGYNILILSDPNLYPEKPGASLLHFMACKANAEALKFLVNFGFDINLLDLDNCSPLGYLVNDELVWQLNNNKKVATVNSECTDKHKIKECIRYLLDLNAKCFYLGKEYDKNYIEDYLNRI